MNPESPVPALEGLVHALEKMAVPWFLTGSVASSLHGLPRSTNDIDIVLELPHPKIAELVKSLEDGYYIDESMVRSAFSAKRACNIIWLETMMKLDLTPPRFPFDGDAMSRRLTARIEDGSGRGIDVAVATPEDTILSKLQWFAIGQRRSQRQLDDISGIVRIQAGKIDRIYLEAWIHRLGLDQVWNGVASRSSYPADG